MLFRNKITTTLKIYNNRLLSSYKYISNNYCICSLITNKRNNLLTTNSNLDVNNYKFKNQQQQQQQYKENFYTYSTHSLLFQSSNNTFNNNNYKTFLTSFLSNPTPVKKNISKVLKFTPTQVFDVVSNVQSYKEFLPFCLDSTILKVIDPTKCFEAQLTVGSGNIKESYISRVTFNSPVFVQASAVNSQLFTHLTSQWRFRPGPTPSTCIAECTLEYQFKSSLYATIMDQFFASSLETMIEAFEKRCKHVYLNKKY